MRKTIKYAFSTCTLAYLIAAALLFIFSISQTGWSRIDNDMVSFLPDGLTLTLSESRWWGDFYYLAILVPWFGSTLVLTLLLYWFDGEAERRRWLGGLSILAYYLAIWLYLIIAEVVRYGGPIRGDTGCIGYLMFLAWPVCGFGAGYLATVVIEKILKPQFTA